MRIIVSPQHLFIIQSKSSLGEEEHPNRKQKGGRKEKQNRVETEIFTFSSSDLQGTISEIH